MLKQVVPEMGAWQSNGIDKLSETSDIEFVEISDDEEMKQDAWKL